MQFFQQLRLNRALFPVVFFSTVLLAGSVFGAQAARTAKTVKSETQTKTVRTVSERAPTLSKDIQKSLEAGNIQKAKRQCGKQCQSDPSMTISAGPNGGTMEYTCNGGNCACAGASDCVAMAPICEEGTLGCNDYGCTCKEGDG
jgi:hypothetical protein